MCTTRCSLVLEEPLTSALMPGERRSVEEIGLALIGGRFDLANVPGPQYYREYVGSSLGASRLHIGLLTMTHKLSSKLALSQFCYIVPMESRQVVWTMAHTSQVWQV